MLGDFSGFQRTNRDGALVFGGFNPLATNATRGSSTVISIDGEAIATGAAALYETYERSMADLVQEIDVYQLGDDRLTLSGECLEWLSCVHGRTLFSGGIWIRKDLRGTPVSELAVPLLPLINRVVGVCRWRAEHIISLQEEAIVRKGIAKRYRVWATASGAMWRLNGKDVPMVLSYTPPIQGIMDARRVALQGVECLLSPSKQSRTVGSNRRAA